jgi:hypothetical protein
MRRRIRIHPLFLLVCEPGTPPTVSGSVGEFTPSSAEMPTDLGTRDIRLALVSVCHSFTFHSDDVG